MQQHDDTVNAAAIVLAAAARSSCTGLLHQRHQLIEDDDHAASCTATKKTRWWSRLKAKLMWFRPHGQPQRIADASAELPGASCAEHTAASSNIFYYTRHAPQPALAFVAPPSSPASSVLTSESPSPVVLLNADISSTYSSPTASIFAIGPYAREPQQLVSPPAFSAGLTEPSTAPLTPPPESGLHLLATTPSSPEVPFAHFLSPPVAPGQHLPTEGYFLHAYQLQPGSPILVSPGSTSSSPAPSFWKMQHRFRSHNEGSLLDGGRVPSTDDGGSDCACSSGSVVRRQEEGTHDDDAATVGAEFVFGNNADAATGGEVGVAGGGSLALGDATEQWPFLLAQTQRSS